MLIRREGPGDHPAVRVVLTEAFKDQAPTGSVPIEVELVDALRAAPEWIPQLAMVAEADEGAVVGHVVCTRGWVDGRSALGLGPLSVAPAAQRRGAGAALMHAVLGAADALDEPLVALLGHTGYYPRFASGRPASWASFLPSRSGPRTSRPARSAPTSPISAARSATRRRSKRCSEPPGRRPGDDARRPGTHPYSAGVIDRGADGREPSLSHLGRHLVSEGRWIRREEQS